MQHAQLEQLRSANSGLGPLVDLLPAPPDREPHGVNNWRAVIVSLFNEVQQQNSLGTGLVAGTQALQGVHHAIDVLTSGFAHSIPR